MVYYTGVPALSKTVFVVEQCYASMDKICGISFAEYNSTWHKQNNSYRAREGKWHDIALKLVVINSSLTKADKKLGIDSTGTFLTESKIYNNGLLKNSRSCKHRH